MPDTPNTEYALQVQALRDLLDDAQHWALASHDIGDSVTAKLPLLRALLETINAAPVVAAPAAQGEAVYLNLPEFVRTGGFQGDNTKLCSSIDALLELDARNALVPHGIGGHARTLLEAAANRIRHAPQPSAPARNPHKELLRQALAAMTALHSSMQPTETHDGGIAPAAAVRAFVNEHARLLAAENLFAAAASQPSADDAPLPSRNSEFGRFYAQLREVFARRFPKCRDCADDGPICPGTGLPCEWPKLPDDPPADAREGEIAAAHALLSTRGVQTDNHDTEADLTLPERIECLISAHDEAMADLQSDYDAETGDARDAVAETRTTICGQCSETVPLPAEPHHYCAACCRADSERLDYVASEYLTLRPIKAGMAIGWQLLNHDASAIVAEVHIDDPRSCIDEVARPQSAWPECSGDPACCPENEGYGCCKPNPADRAMGGES
ncbi:MAG: hypothetical protein BGP24_14880 [Lysobacterales bacterium 69-70]|nr:hypothetical protein [Xanthomonadaceae bacterium]ODU35368.1 MAG: hypothetical protein ABS97_05705 [Xanthomonadaceae bacterium SCN 69-320]ODV16867.1 MAG: hypothetical protein ABT27_19010 [Xanthomonadaceae bacterium SCN 69-25]OJY94263.1 MAG: hypothetical protein BGP24_14880 [Xanthomonadales bacterium 69-70]